MSRTILCNRVRLPFRIHCETMKNFEFLIKLCLFPALSPIQLFWFYNQTMAIYQMPRKHLCESMGKVITKTSDLNLVSHCLGRRGWEAETYQEEDELNLVLFYSLPQNVTSELPHKERFTALAERSCCILWSWNALKSYVTRKEVTLSGAIPSKLRCAYWFF